MPYQNIQNYPDNAIDLGSSELRALSTVWKDTKDALQQTGVFQEFLHKMQREWAIETGIIERLYTWDRGVTEMLIEQGIDASVIAHQGGVGRQKADHVKNVINDQLSIIEGLFAFVKGEEPLTEYFIRGLQAQFTDHQDTTAAVTPDGKLVQVTLEKGKYKKYPNNPRRPDGQEHFYCPPELTQIEMRNLIDWYTDAENKYPAEVNAAWLHHRFTQIHPFQDGNGRVARALASLVFLKAGLFPLVIRDSDRKEYIAALEEADAGDLQKLLILFVKRQKDAILRALNLEERARQNQYAEQIISSTLGVLKNQTKEAGKRFARVYEYAEKISVITKTRLNAVSNSLSSDLDEINRSNQSRYISNVSNASNRSSDTQHYFYYQQIADIADEFGYYANIERYHEWLRLEIYTDEKFEFIISIHGYGRTNNGVMAALAFTAERIPQAEKGSSQLINVRPATTDVLQFNYAEPIDSIQKRFKEWFESALIIALAEWKRQVAVLN